MPKSRGLYAVGGALGDLYGAYHGRVIEYRFAAHTAFELGIFRHDSPVLDVGCRNPYEGMLKFLRSWGWDDEQASRWLATPYVGIDVDLDADVLERASEDDKVLLVERDLEGASFGGNGGVKQFAVAFCLEILEHLVHAEELVEQIKTVAATIMVTGLNADFGGWYPEVVDHVQELTAEMLQGWGFQEVGYVNFNGRPSKAAAPYPWNNGECATSSEVWGLWRDARAQALYEKPREKEEASVRADSEMGDYLRARQMLRAAGHELRVEKPEVRHGR
jgi:hypothetical protein